jgi:uncharacterized tellurite resistance protein B-like protein
MSLAEKIAELFEKGEAVLAVDQDSQPIGIEVQIAAAALLLEAAYGDEEYHSSEKAVIEHGLEVAFDLTHAETRNLMEKANEYRLKTGDITPFLREVCGSYTTEQKQSLLELIKRVVEADGKVRLVESVLYDYAREKLGLDFTEPEVTEVPE